MKILLEDMAGYLGVKVLKAIKEICDNDPLHLASKSAVLEYVADISPKYVSKLLFKLRQQGYIISPARGAYKPTKKGLELLEAGEGEEDLHEGIQAKQRFSPIIVPISRETLSKYEIKDNRKIREIHEAMKKAKTIKAKRGVLYEIDDGVFIGVDRKGRLRIYLV